ncbi:type II toxin-antitoxin system VapC family toxin [Candidatus Bathyarchaeota archaeon]|nr:type II toxin-antitoxin system VapC family toxin [Candidatus Bathyarchaeota archaeon]
MGKGHKERQRNEMKLFDSSAIINLCAEKNLDPLLEGFTLNLALYELGNAVWKQVYIHNTITVEEANIILDSLAEVFGKMRKLKVEHPLETLKIAVEEKITYYDAAYLHTAVKNNLTLVTDDEKLYRIGKKYVKTVKSKEVSEYPKKKSLSSL